MARNIYLRNRSPTFKAQQGLFADWRHITEVPTTRILQGETARLLHVVADRSSIFWLWRRLELYLCSSRRMQRIRADAGIIPKKYSFDNEASTFQRMPIDDVAPRDSKRRTAVPHNRDSWRRDCVVWLFLVCHGRIHFLLLIRAFRKQKGCSDSRASNSCERFRLQTPM